MKTLYVKTKDVDRKWYLIDAEGKTLGRVAVKAATLLRGKHKPIFVPHHEIGDFVVIINADKIAVTGAKRTDKMYYNHSGQPGGMRVTSFEKMMERKPTYPLEVAIRGMLPKNRLGRKLLGNAKVYAGGEHPHGAQQPEMMEI